MAAEAGLSTDLVVISSIAAGSVQVLSIVYFPSSFPNGTGANLSAGVTPGSTDGSDESAEDTPGSTDSSDVGIEPVVPITCGNAPCYPGVLCTDLNVTTGGFVCGSCPEGYTDVDPSTPGSNCADVDECSDLTLENGGCDPETACTNTVGGRECSGCPAGYLGDGESGCRPKGASCAEDNGGCDALTSCTEVEGEAAACSECPTGYAGTGATACVDLDGCKVMPCFPGTLCEDVAAPEVGFICHDCPSGFWGDGVNCERDLCLGDPPPCSELVSCTSTPGGGFTCSACPSGYDGDGTTCEDVNECEQPNNGGCDVRTACTNVPGGRECGECPTAFLGSGYTQCAPSSTCDTNNGGCDALTVCTDTESGVPICGDCPVGYTGAGSTGCVDVDGCAEAAAEGEGCYPGAFCADVPAPASGFTCGACPVGMEGDGTVCWENLCFNANGGCDARVSCTNTPDRTPARLCGACPAGYMDAFQDGTKCAEEDGCAVGPCFPGVECTDVSAPGVGATCGECPAGYLAADQDVTPACVDVDECLQENGG
ncbi:hypothetical protein CYMTET_54942 [Cymbomonas tetramitiformis]|uniref:EGF-like domain-containing protein n=1 Tax=Cymbomonas tetramitiformis TaxID=36881 RepID=A0AAE0ENG9_9CHLO|nr:hypothetical protein CYMTET_54942 [Cymbomonas tetramitiformis]